MKFRQITLFQIIEFCNLPICIFEACSPICNNPRPSPSKCSMIAPGKWRASYNCGPYISIHLLSVGGSSSEVGSERPSTHKEITGYNADSVRPPSEDIEASGLPAPVAGLAVPTNIVEESTSSARDEYSVANTFQNEGVATSAGKVLPHCELLIFDTFDNPPSPEGSRLAVSLA